jgi:hypothetical protein
MILKTCICGKTCRSDKELQDHKSICLKNGKTEKERFEARKKINKKINL